MTIPQLDIHGTVLIAILKDKQQKAKNVGKKCS